MTMIEQVAQAIEDHPDTRYLCIGASSAVSLAKAAIIAALPHIKEAMEYHGVEGAMNKMIIKRIEDQLK